MEGGRCWVKWRNVTGVNGRPVVRIDCNLKEWEHKSLVPCLMYLGLIPFLWQF